MNSNYSEQQTVVAEMETRRVKPKSRQAAGNHHRPTVNNSESQEQEFLPVEHTSLTVRFFLMLMVVFTLIATLSGTNDTITKEAYKACGVVLLLMIMKTLSSQTKHS